MIHRRESCKELEVFFKHSYRNYKTADRKPCLCLDIATVNTFIYNIYIGTIRYDHKVCHLNIDDVSWRDLSSDLIIHAKTRN